jgi:ankyrin repeat protein
VISDMLYRSPLHMAATWGNPELIALLLDADGPRDARDSDGATALLLATLTRRTENVAALLTGGAQTDIGDEYGFTPLMAAARDGQVDTAKLLLAAGANTHLVDQSGQGLDYYLNWHPVAPVLPEGSRAASIGHEPTPEELATLDAAHAEIRALIMDRNAP